MTKTSAQWWAETKADPAKLNDWLVKQFRGEVTAASRIQGLVDKFNPEEKVADLLHRIAGDEILHASWVLDLLAARGIEPQGIDEAEERYWAATLPGITTLDEGMAVGAHAEAMRLERIKVIAADEDAPYDIRTTFAAILKDEVFHERAFRTQATPEALAATKAAHNDGMNALGLVH